MLVLVGSAVGCTHGLFSGISYPDRSRPVARIETRGGVEYGATTVEGILFLGRTAQEGPCRVHYFLGPRATPLVEDGTIYPAAGGFHIADIDLKHQSVELLGRDLTPDDELVAVVFEDRGTREVPMKLAAGAGLRGDLLAWPGESIPAGTGLFVRDEHQRWLFAGLISGEVTSSDWSDAPRWLTFAGTDRVRELLATPRVHPPRPVIVHRPDDISKVKAAR